MILRYGLILSLLILSLDAAAQPKREFRGVWVATVQNIDWPPAGQFDPGAQGSQLVSLFDSLASAGFNAVVFQVRPSADAFYPSSIEPWSEWLTGTQGQAPTSAWDPLLYAINLAHARGMELHAWFNPYRTVVSTTASSVAASHISNTHPEWNLQFGTLKMLDPGLPEVRDYVTSVIMDVVRRYDIDGVHFDDYFYPYSGITTEDQSSYAAHGGGMPLGNWRRDNVNKLVKMVHDSLRAVKPWVKFGISPFGIWRNQGTDPSGSATSGLESFDAIYCDTRHWLQQGWLDYVTPQVYWTFSFAAAPYGVLIPWWNANANARHVYVGQAYHRLLLAGAPNDYYPRSNWPAKDMVDQIALNRQHSNVLGIVAFSAKYFMSNTKTINDTLRLLSFQESALLPTMAWIDSVAPMPPESLVVVHPPPSYAVLRSKPSPAASDGDTAKEYLLYRSFSLPIDYSNMANVVKRGSHIEYLEDTRFFFSWETAYYAVTALDRHQNESAPSNIIGITSTGTVGVPDELIVPKAVRLYQNFPNPFNPVTVVGFEVQEETQVSLRVYDLLGREVAVLWDDMALPGYRQVIFDGVRLPSGTYFYRLMAGGKVETKRMQLVR